MLVSDVIDRVYSEWLYPAGINRPAWDTVATQGVLSGVTNGTFTVAGRVANIPNDTILEIDSELITTSSFAGVTVTTQDRGYLDSDPTTHIVGAKVYIDPKYPRIAIFHAIQDVIRQLYPHGLYLRVVDTNTMTFDPVNLVALPTGATKAISVMAQRYASPVQYRRLRQGYDFEEYDDFSPPKLRLFRGGYIGAPLVVTYAKDFTAPSAESDDLLSVCGVPLTLQPHLAIAVTGYLLMGRDTTKLQTEEIRRLLAAQGVQVGQSLQIGRTLYDWFFAEFLENEKKRQQENDETTFEWVG